MTRFMLALGLAISILVLAPSQAFACSCRMADLAEQAGWADQVVTGTVRVKDEQTMTTDYEVTVDGSYKGDLVRVLTVSSSNQGPSCGMKLVSDERYLLFLQGKGDRVTTNSCSGTTQLTDAVEAQVVAALGEPRVMKGAPSATPDVAPGGTVSVTEDTIDENSNTLKIISVSGGLAVIAALSLMLYRRQRL